MSKVLLGEVVNRIKDKVDKDNTDLVYYIGGEHIDSDEVRITKKGVIAGSTIGPAFHMRFMPGDVLLMSRSPHLRKAGVVDFEGICSDVSYVCRTKDEKVLSQRFLPFILRTDDFWSFAENNKKGSTNPFLNWSDFEKYEFNLPSIERQGELAELLWSAEEAKASYRELSKASSNLIQAQFAELFYRPEIKYTKICEVCEFITKGTTPPTSEIIKTPQEDSVPYLKVYNLSYDGTLLFDNEPQYISKEIHNSKLARSKVYSNDVLMNIVGPPLGKFAIVTDEFPEWNVNQAIAFFRAKEKIRPKYMLYALMHPRFLVPFLEKAVGIRQLNISLDQCRNIEIPLPGLEAQDAFISFAEDCEKVVGSFYTTEMKLIAMQKAILDKSLFNTED